MGANQVIGAGDKSHALPPANKEARSPPRPPPTTPSRSHVPHKPDNHTKAPLTLPELTPRTVRSTPPTQSHVSPAHLELPPPTPSRALTSGAQSTCDAPQPQSVLSTAARPLPCDARSRASFVDDVAGASATSPSLRAPDCYTRAEVRRLTEERKRIILFIRNKVYDVTDYAARHPGGASVLRFNCNKDATEDFESMHDAYAFGELRKWCIGRLVEDKDGVPNSRASPTSASQRGAVCEPAGTPHAKNDAANRRTLVANQFGEVTAEAVSRYVAASAQHLVIILFGDVYDVSDYAARHPGGLRVLQNNNNKECGALFMRIHGARAKAMVAQYYVGRLQGSTLVRPVTFAAPKAPAAVAMTPPSPAASRANTSSDTVHSTRLLELRLSGANHAIRYLTFAMPEPLRLLPGGHVRILRDAASDEGRSYTPYHVTTATFAICVKHASSAGVSHALFSLKENDEVFYTGPFPPNWIAEQDARLNDPALRVAEERHVLLVGGGVGVVPLYSIALDLLRRRFARVTLVCSFRTLSDMVLAAELKELAHTYCAPTSASAASRPSTASALRVILCLTHTTTEKTVRWAQEVFMRRVSASVLRQAEVATTQAAVLCGPPSFTEAVARAVVDCGLCLPECVHVL